MKKEVYLIVPPFTQLNTPYPSTAYLKGFLNTKAISSHQCDLGIEVTLTLFSAEGLKNVFNEIEKSTKEKSENSIRILSLKKAYLSSIDLVIQFLQGKKPTLAHAIVANNFLPRASRFEHTEKEDLDWAFGTMGIQDRARHLATLYLEDLSDLIKDELDENFGFTRYAERLGRSANSFDELEKALNNTPSFIDGITIDILENEMAKYHPKLVVISVPFPGNLYSGLKCGQWIKKNYPETKIAFGGGFANTELRSLSDIRVFDYLDFIALDDGEAPLENILEYINGKRAVNQLKRTFVAIDEKVVYCNASELKDYSQAEVGTPDYTDLKLHDYISVIEIANPMHSLWGNGRWNKLTLAHGCYWGKCTFCDISLDYIKRYEQTTAPLLCDRIEQLVRQTGESGFHFVDEAAPPGLLRDLALEIIKRDLKIVWWTNIRFEKTFSADLCLLLKASGCIAISGGLEVASNRLLQLIEKGVTVEQVAQVCQNITDAGILVHAYLMYGYPTQTAQETVDSLEMVRQMFELGIVQSGFWHRFAMTTHSPVGLAPEKYNCSVISPLNGGFANNDLEYFESNGINHGAFSEGLRISLFNYMNGTGFDMRLQDWFGENRIPKTSVPKNLIETYLAKGLESKFHANSKIIYLGNQPSFTNGLLKVEQVNDTLTLELENPVGTWVMDLFTFTQKAANNYITFKEFEAFCENNRQLSLNQFVKSELRYALREFGLLLV